MASTLKRSTDTHRSEDLGLQCDGRSLNRSSSSLESLTGTGLASSVETQGAPLNEIASGPCFGRSHTGQANLMETSDTKQPLQPTYSARKDSNSVANKRPLSRKNQNITRKRRYRRTTPGSVSKKRARSCSPSRPGSCSKKGRLKHKQNKLLPKRRRPPRRALIASSGSKRLKTKPLPVHDSTNLNESEEKFSDSDSDTEIENHSCTRKNCPGCQSSTLCGNCPYCKKCLECPQCKFCSPQAHVNERNELLSRKRKICSRVRHELLIASSDSESENDLARKRSRHIDHEFEKKNNGHNCLANVCAGCETSPKCELCPTCQKCLHCPDCDHCWGRPNRSRKRQRELPKRFAALKIFGTHGYRSKFMFLRACRNSGIPITGGAVAGWSKVLQCTDTVLI